MGLRTRSVAMIVAVLLLSACGQMSSIFESRVGNLLGIVDGARTLPRIVVGTESLNKTADALAKPMGTSEATAGPVVEAVRSTDPESHFVITYGYDACTRQDPRLVKHNGGLTVEYTRLDRNCVAPQRVTAVFEVAWSEVPDSFYVGTDPTDPGRPRVDGRVVTEPRQWTSKVMTRKELPNSPVASFDVATDAKEAKELLDGPDVRLKTKYGKSDVVIVSRYNGCPTRPRLVLLGKRLVFHSPVVKDAKAKCGTNTVELAAFVIARKDLPKKFTVGTGERPGDADVTVTLD